MIIDYLSCLLVAHRASGVGDNNQRAKRVDVAVRPAHRVPGPLLVHRDVGLLLVIGHLVLEVVLGVVVHGLKVRASTDLGDFLVRSIAESNLGRCKAQWCNQQDEQLKNFCS